MCNYSFIKGMIKQIIKHEILADDILYSIEPNKISIKSEKITINDIGTYWIYACIKQSENEENIENNCMPPQKVIVGDAL